jgi:sulfide:quinone oxidoreductase
MDVLFPGSVKLWCPLSSAGFKVELACIIDSLDSGTLLTRSSARTLLLPSTRLLHWLKRLFEWWYQRQYR